MKINHSDFYGRNLYVAMTQERIEKFGEPKVMATPNGWVFLYYPLVDITLLVEKKSDRIIGVHDGNELPRVFCKKCKKFTI
jgi:hypothetical protein